MFRNMGKTEKKVFSVILILAFYFIFSLVFGIGDIISSPSPQTILRTLPYLWPVKLVLGAAISFLLVYNNQSLDDIEAKTIGQGQYGSARWATAKEKREIYRYVPDGHEKEPGFVIGREQHDWIVDHSDSNLLLLAPPGGGKTKRVLIPTVCYNAMVNRKTGQGASLLFTDCKGELKQSCGEMLKRSGYHCLYLDFRNPLQSYQFNLMHNINGFIDQYRKNKGKSAALMYYGRAERYAKVLASCIIENMESPQQSEAGAYFTNTSKGLLTGMILLVSEYAAADERHIISVFRLIIELTGLTEGSTDAQQKSKLAELMEQVDNERIMNYVGPAISADNRTAMNVFSSALGKLVDFIDAELEPLVCGHSPELNDFDFIEKPTAVFLICPDENTTRHFFASLFIRFWMNDLIEQAEENGGQLRRKVLAIWDEFGNMPPVKSVDVLFTAVRSRGIRFLISLQSFAQLEKSYTRTMAQVIRDACQTNIFTYVSPSSRATAEELSKALGNRTIQSGSITNGKQGSESLQMIGRPLLTPDEIINLPAGTFVTMKAGRPPAKEKLPLFWDYLPEYPDDAEKVQTEIKNIVFCSVEKLLRPASRGCKLYPGQFD